MLSKLEAIATALNPHKPVSQGQAAQRKSFSLRGLLIIPFILQLGITTGLIGYWSFRNGQKTINELVVNLQNQAIKQIDQHLNSYLANARHLNELNASTINSGLINPSDQDSLGQFFWQQAKLYNVGYILFGTKSGEYVDVGRPQTYPLELITERISPQRYGNAYLYVYEPDAKGKLARLIDSDTEYLFQKEPWYAEVMRTGKPLWTPVYTWQAASTNPLAVAISSPVYDSQNNLIGAIAIEQRLLQISTFLKQLQISPSATIFIVERDGHLIASSGTAPPFQLVKGNPARLSAVDSPDTIIQATAQSLTDTFGSFHAIQQRQQVNLIWQDQRQFVQATPWRDDFGLNWVVVMVIPEADFMEQININTRYTVLLCMTALMIAIAIGILTAQKIIQPILQINTSAKAIADGKLDQTVDIKGVHELELLSGSFNRMAHQLQQSFNALEEANQVLEQRVKERTAKLEQANQELQRLSQVDGLTQIANRRCFDEYLIHEWQCSQREQQPLSLILCDIDYFKDYNDFYGHQGGDCCLRKVAKLLQQIAKRPADLVARYGGEEFALILPATHESGAIAVAQSIQQTLHQAKLPHARSKISKYVTLSLGISSVIPLSMTSPEDFIVNADQALYEAKRRGRDRYVFH